MRIAFCIQCVDRPEYADQLLNRLDSAHDTEAFDWYWFQAGPRDRWTGETVHDEQKIQSCLDAAQSSGLDLSIRYDGFDDGYFMTKIQMLNLLDMEYDAVIMHECDIDVSDHIVRVYQSLLEQFPEDAVSAYMSRPFEESMLDRLDEVEKHDVAWMFSLGITEQVRDAIADHLDCFVRSFYNDGQQWDAEYGPSLRHVVFDDSTAPGSDGVYWPVDGTFSKLFNEQDIKFVKPAASRASHIGTHGATMSQVGYDTYGYFGREGPLTYDVDRHRTSWKYDD